MRTEEEIVEMLRRCIRHELPIINRGIEIHGDATVLINRFRLLAEAVDMASRTITDPDLALRLLQFVSFGLSSVERHLQFAGGVPGDGVAALGAEATLLRLSTIAGHPPRDSHYTYWLMNRGNAPMTFTGSPQESMFIRVVNEMHQRQMVSVAAIGPLCRGDVPAVSPMAVEAIEFAAENHERLTTILKSFMSPATEWSMSPAFFAFTIRPYLRSYPVGGEVFPGPDAMNLPGQMQIDLAIGLADDAYRQTIAGRMCALMPNDRTLIESMANQPALIDRILERAGLTEIGILRMSEMEIADFAARRPWLRATLYALERLTKAVQSSAAHFAIIQGYLRSRRRMQRDEETMRIVRMRKTQPVVQKLIGAAYVERVVAKASGCVVTPIRGK